MHFQWSNFSLWKSFDIFLILEPGFLIIDVHCLFGVFRSPRAFFTHMETSLLLVKARAVNFNLCSTPMAIELWGFFSVPNLLWHGASVYNGHLPGHVTLTSVASSVANTTCFFDLGLLRLEFEHPTFRMRGEHFNPLCRPRSDLHCKGEKLIIHIHVIYLNLYGPRKKTA